MDNEDIFIFHKCDLDPHLALTFKDVLKSNYSEKFDIKLQCFDGYCCHGHQSILRLSSKHFKNKIDDYYKISDQSFKIPNEELVINIPKSIDSKDIEDLINFIYTGIVYIPESRVQKFLFASKELKVFGLKNIELIYKEQKSEEFLVNIPFTRNKIKYSENDNQQNNNFKKYIKMSKSKIKNSNKKSKIQVKKSFDYRKEFRGRKPQTGSPMITEKYKIGNMYRCNLCEKAYIWKKTLVRHYKDLHPKTIDLFP